ncbi:pyrroloquinoline quinone biosynthesis peptide chaperone PqqD [Acetobacteraceae bacterium ESL0709]|nr:pyrroloquinoline quinone biosynthesis peptide chaperone PqqD [Acetobacteraceae bacterium ESL0697]MDF7678977.1 pyrroloquinoline quinone biosynthesis peptide chaperone PqqD [Acetobacteraceae bacterium ESL0709]
MLTESCCLKFARGHRLQHDTVRHLWIIQAPEKAFIADEIAAATLKLVDGKRSLKEIIDALTADYQADRSIIARDVTALLAELRDKGVLNS